MGSCPDICTADKCRELENRIEILEQDLALLKASFESHTQQDIPEAHKYEPNVDVALAVNSSDNSLKVFVAVDNQNDSETVTLPQPDVDVALAVNSSDNSLKVFVAVGNKNDSETITLPQPDVDVALAVDSSNNSLKVFVAVGNKNDSETITLPQPDVDVALAVDSSNNSLKVFVAVGNKNDSETITLPKPELDVNVEASINNDKLTIDVKVGNESDSDIVDLPEINPSDWIDLLKDILFDLLKDLLFNELKDYLKDLIRDLLKELINDLKDLIRDLLKELIEEIVEGIFELIKEYIDDLLNQQKYITGQAFYNDGLLTISIDSSIGDTTFDVEIPMADLDDIKRLIEEIYKYTVIDVNGETVTEFICAEEAEDGETVEHSQLAYTGKSFTGLHALLKTVNDNLLTVFTEICEKNPVLAAPDWWQVRLRGSVPQIVCTFRRGNTRTYHSLSIPHPANTSKPEDALIPEYQKGNWQGMIVLNDNSKFIINCDSSSEAERMCNVARGLINPNFLPIPFKVWLTERKGEPVTSDPMKPTTIMYYSTGQRNLKPDWYMAIPKNNPNEI